MICRFLFESFAIWTSSNLILLLLLLLLLLLILIWFCDEHVILSNGLKILKLQIN